MPIFHAHFTTDGTQVIITGRRNYFYVYTLSSGEVEKIHGIRGRDEKSFEQSYVSPCNKYIAILGRDGYIILLSMTTKQWVGDMKINGNVTTIAFSYDFKHMYALGSEGQVYVFDLKTRKCMHRFTDHGCIGATTIAVSPDSNWIATGSSTGVVNLYTLKYALSSSSPIPEKAILNLIAPITTLKFHPSSQMLVLAAKEVKDSLRVFHIPTMRIFNNWPTERTPLGEAPVPTVSSF
jgi:U3 small nucleolar RNA-associated protein 18